ncbi:MAG: MlaA family lipoprotein [Candidatus Methylomirabilia bacterium]
MNNLLPLKLKGAGRELMRFLLNTTVGVADFFDVAKTLGIEESKEDTGQTLAIYGVGPGPYLLLPFLPHLTVRDGIGFGVDAALDPFNYVIFLVAALTTIGAGERVNDRALNPELFETVKEATRDLYTGVQNAYLQRRQKAIEE